jgi:ribosomal protein S27AE
MIRLRTSHKDAPIETQTPADTVAPDVYPAEPQVDDHALHFSDQTCARCGNAFAPHDEARRTAKGECVHTVC